MTHERLKTACLQLNSGSSIEANIPAVDSMIRQAAGQGAKLICTPENTCHIRAGDADRVRTSIEENIHPALLHYRKLTAELGVWLLIGSLTVRVSPHKVANRSFLIGSDGAIAARYDKIHLFDVDLPTGETHRESNSMQGGENAVVAQTPWCKIGMSICYDVRFAYLYRAMAQAGAAVMTVPAAFTVPTGQAHWSILLRARAIETGSFILAPAQCGAHEGGRRTYGHSMIVDPWGEVLAEAGDEPEIIAADLDLSAVEKARRAIPALRHDRPIKFS